MGNNQSMKKINYEDVQYAIKNRNAHLIINTLPLTEQHCLIINTVNAQDEESIINKYMKENKAVHIIIYGRNANDDSINNKYQQLLALGFYNIYIYLGGMFEWLLLQDIYGKDLFPTTKKELDLLKYKPKQCLQIGLLEY